MPITINRALNYNEQKVQQDKAICIGEGNALLPADTMNFYQKLELFERRNELNERAKTNTIHISLNFDPSENPDTSKLNQIAAEYMNRLGFGEQPYLVYQHHDAAHPHIHIVSTTIRADGTRINTHNLGKDKSEPARKIIEEKFGLVPASKQEKAKEFELRPIGIEKAAYGYSETRRSIANIVSQVVDQYNFISLPHFNAILKQYNVIADEGKENGIIRKNNGLQYRLLDGQGNKIGVPIKASSLPGQPTKANLEKKYKANEPERELCKLALKAKLEMAIQQRPASLADLIKQLSSNHVNTLLRTNAEGRTYGITFIDTKDKAAFNGSELGKAFSVSGLEKQLQINSTTTSTHNQSQEHFISQSETIEVKLLDELLKTEWENQNTPYHLRKRKRRDSDKN